MKKKLRVKLIETLNEVTFSLKILFNPTKPDTQNKLLEFFENEQQSTARSRKLSDKITLDNVPQVSDSATLQKMLDDNKGIIRLSPSRRRSASAKKALICEENNKSPEVKINESPLKLTKTPEPTSDEKIRSARNEPYDWENNKEETFLTQREMAKSRFSRKAKSSNWNQLGFTTFVQECQNDEKSKQQSETKLAKYMNGDLLTPDEYKLIANSSLLLNEYTDKKFFQTVVNNLDPEIIETVSICDI